MEKSDEKKLDKFDETGNVSHLLLLSKYTKNWLQKKLN